MYSVRAASESGLAVPSLADDMARVVLAADQSRGRLLQSTARAVLYAAFGLPTKLVPGELRMRGWMTGVALPEA